MASVKTKRPYDSRGRLERARQTQERILDAATQLFLAAGYATTTVAAIASKAKVSAESIYKTFGGKPGLVRAIHERGLAGEGPRPAPARADAVSATEADPRVIVRQWGTLMAEVSPLVSPILLLARSAAAFDADLAGLLKETDDKRLARMRDNARVLAKRGFLRRGLSVEQAAEIMWAQTSPELYDLFVVRRGWTPARLGDFVASVLIGVLLPEP